MAYSKLYFFLLAAMILNACSPKKQKVSETTITSFLESGVELHRSSQSYECGAADANVHQAKLSLRDGKATFEGSHLTTQGEFEEITMAGEYTVQGNVVTILLKSGSSKVSGTFIKTEEATLKPRAITLTYLPEPAGLFESEVIAASKSKEFVFSEAHCQFRSRIDCTHPEAKAGLRTEYKGYFCRQKQR